MGDLKKAYKVAIDDNILMKDSISTAGSKILNNFVPPFNAAVIDKAKASGMEIAARTSPNEFGVALAGAFGSIDLVAGGGADIGIACDVNGAIRNQAVKNGICFIKPTYGTVSRFGLVSTAPSMEQIGIACNDIEDGFDALSAISGFDERDGTLAENEKYDYSAKSDDIKGLRVALLGSGDEMEFISEKLKDAGAAAEPVSFSLERFVPAAAYIIMCAETSNSISRYDGIKFGYRSDKNSNLEDIYYNSRGECFTAETKALTLMGMYVLTKGQFDAAFDKSLKTRRLIKEELGGLLEKFDCVAMPAGSREAGQESPFDAFCRSYENLKHSALPNMTGTPAIALPIKDGGGVQFVSKAFDENKLLQIGKWFQKMTKEVSR